MASNQLAWLCRECARLNNTEPLPSQSTPLLITCPCGSRYQLTREGVRWIETRPVLPTPQQVQGMDSTIGALE